MDHANGNIMKTVMMTIHLGEEGYLDYTKWLFYR